MEENITDTQLIGRIYTDFQDLGARVGKLMSDNYDMKILIKKLFKYIDECAENYGMEYMVLEDKARELGILPHESAISCEEKDK